VVLVLFSDPTGHPACVLEEYTKYYESGVENPLEPAARDEQIGPQRQITVNLWKGV
jgi:hypothetical protein